MEIGYILALHILSKLFIAERSMVLVRSSEDNEFHAVGVAGGAGPLVLN